MGLKEIWSNVTVEPVLFLFSLSHGLYVIVAQSLYLDKVCNVNLNYTREICDNIFLHKAEQIEVQKYVSELQAYNGILQALPSIVYALFAGPWSDQNGRRVLIGFSCLGYVFNNGVFILNTWFSEWRAEYLLFECLQDFTGGSVCFFLGCYAYISDVSTKKQRTKRLAFLDGLFPIGFFTGLSISGVIKKKWGFIPNFALGMGAAILAVIYTMFFLKDSRLNRPEEVKQSVDLSKSKDEGPPKLKRFFCAEMFDLNNLKAAFHATFHKRDHGLRPYLILLMVTFILEIFMSHGRGPTMFLYIRKEFAWDEATFGQYIALFGVIGLFTQYVAVPFLTETLKFHDTTLGFWGVIGSLINTIIMAFAREGWWLYLGSVIAFLGPTITTSSRSLVTKCVGPFEVGAAFSIMGAIQAMVPLCAIPFFGFTYKATIEWFPGTFLLVSAVLYVIVAVLLIVANIGLRKVERTEKKSLQRTQDEEDKCQRLMPLIGDKETLDVI
ncbi:lysosomal proton-coupled steroid conjugate and bile acid symporter SLC46A3-like [Tigriopus californicus]|uniref:lysosomal proton-coupled steroid conjugate and bile acid symporter SLC46A3-like n=1 Tax=Tigriopus californicus TaxID=6832 RepID=UPI0027DA6B93|nr:lysosomal proton-coupled steroid conjugate and bile acid symporter SLC46A3-like [Tigriopus californicus]